MKICSKCNADKNLNEFYQSGKSIRTECKACFKAKRLKNGYYQNDKKRFLIASKNQQQSTTLSYYIVYGLPNEMYCGITNNIYKRMNSHRSNSKDTTGDFIISIHSTKSEALKAEKEQHQKGWLGSKICYTAQECFK